MQEHGVRLIARGLWYLSHAHSDEDIAFALAAARDVLGDIA
jgi:glutamate-1-semialdehyde aminotransferase